MTYEQRSKFLKTVSERGFVHQCTDMAALDALLHESEQAGKPVVAYIGFDCTAPSLHIGSLIQIMMLKWWQEAGHKPIVLMGGGTTKVGDPSGKDASRQLLDDAAIEKNMAGIKQVFSEFLGEFETKFSETTSAAYMVNNDEWLSGLNYIEFLRDYGRFFSVNEMLGRDSVKMRLERDQRLSFLEFNYMVLQGYDFVELAKRYACRVQMGGSDQWGNILSGVDLFKKSTWPGAQDLFPDAISKELGDTLNKLRDEGVRKHYCFGLTTPLLTTASGAKMGKTAEGAVWLNPELFAPYDYWQFWRNVEDADVARFMGLFTMLPMEKINEVEVLIKLKDKRINEAKKVLATEVTTLLHGRPAAEKARRTAEETFEQGLTSASLPEILVAKSEFGEGMQAHRLFQLSGLAPSGKEARRLIEGGGARVQDEAVADANHLFTLADFKDDALKLSAGKKRHVLVKLS